MFVTGFVRGLVIFALFICLVRYVIRSLAKYQHGRIGVTISEKPAESSEFPAVMVCGIVEEARPIAELEPWVKFVIHDYTESGSNETHEEMWVFRNGTVLNWIKPTGLLWKDILVPAHGNFYFCNAYIPPPGIQTPHTLYTQVRLFLKEPQDQEKDYMVHIGHPDLLTFGGRFLGNGFKTFTIDPSRAVTTEDFHLQIGEVMYISQKDRPCLSSKQLELLSEQGKKRDFMGCCADYLTRRVPCYANSGLLNCTEEDIRKLGIYRLDLLAKVESSFLKEIGCMPPCHIATFDITSQKTLEQGRLTSATEREKNFIIALRIIKEEFLIYDAESLAGDVGGVIGMLLGTSVLAMYDTLRRGLGHCFRRTKKDSRPIAKA